MFDARDLWLMQEALLMARRGESQGEVPVGAVCAIGDRIIARAHNQRERRRDPFGHAEMLAMSKAASFLGRWRLSDLTLVVTLEPCPMCAGAILLARLPRLVYGAADPKAGAVRSHYRLLEDPKLNHRTEVLPGVEEEACSRLLTDFFRARREEG